MAVFALGAILPVRIKEVLFSSLLRHSDWLFSIHQQADMSAWLCRLACYVMIPAGWPKNWHHSFVRH